MKKYFKTGLATLIPIALPTIIVMWLYDVFKGFIKDVIPTSLGYEWWYVVVFLIALVIGILLLGIIMSFIKPLRWIKAKIEKLIDKVPSIIKIYNFGKEIADSYITDIKDDGDLEVVEVMFAGQKTLGILNDKKNNLVFIPTAPNPLNGFIIKTTEYIETDISMVNFLKMLASLGKINGWRWKWEDHKDNLIESL